MSTLSPEQIDALSEDLEAAELEGRAVIKITDEHPEMDFEDAYAIQWATRRRKIARGHRMVGMKMGLTSHAKMRQMGVEEPIYGFLADYFQRPEGEAIDVCTLIHPRVEAEIAFMTRAPLRGPGCHVGQVLASTEFVMPAVEIIDSRYENFRFDLPSVIADNASSSRFVTGGAIAGAQEMDLRTVGVVLEKNGEPVEVGAGAAVLNHPASSIALLANMLAARGEELPAGSLILSGGITAAASVAAGDSVTLRAQGMGSVSLRFK
uniref:4-oxalocrotonate decarboxylase n=1 Tax=Arhodomonas sp. Seminole TaxID=1204713 RepID=A0A076YFA1_9GAMM|nr:4-oxalocrotonate decarboxylase [Arhodomonas sp. Seminole]